MESFDVIAWYGIMGPAGVPASIQERLAVEIKPSVRVPEITQKLNAMGFEVVGTSPREFSTHVRQRGREWARVVKQSGAKLD